MKKLRQAIITLQVVLCSAILINVPPVLAQQTSTYPNKKAPQDSVILKSNEPLERELAGGQTHVYRVALKANEFLQVRVEQKGVDVVVIISSPDNKKLAEMDSPNGTTGSEVLSWVALTAGEYEINISALEAGAAKGNYVIRREASRTATEKDRRRVAVERVFVEGMTARDAKDEAQRAQALPKFQEALGGWQELNDSYLTELTAQQVQQLKPQNTPEKDRKRLQAENLMSDAFKLKEQGTAESLRQAIKLREKAVILWRELEEKQQEGMALTLTAISYTDLNEKQKALDYLNQALPLFREVKNKRYESMVLGSIGKVYDSLGEGQKALEYFNQALPLFREVKNKTSEAATLSNAGLIYSELGEIQKALDYLNQALPLNRAVDDKSDEAQTLGNIGFIYSNLGENQKALEYSHKVLTLFRIVKDQDGEATTLGVIGTIYADLGERQKALEYFSQALPLFRLIRNRRSEAIILSSIGAVYGYLDDSQKALDYSNRALLLNRAVGDKSSEANTLHTLMGLYYINFSNPRLAIVFGKQSVNTYQQLRSNIQSLDKSVQQIYLKSVENPYRRLAEILVKQGRLPEAEQVLELLKEEEYFQFVRRDDKVAKDLLTRISLSPAEKDALERYEKIADETTKLGDEFAKLEEQRVKLPAEQTASIVAQQDAINRKLEDARKTLQIFLEELKKEFSGKDIRVALVEEGLQSAVKGWNEPDTVVISTIVGEKSLSIIVTTADIQRAHIVDKIGSEPFSEERLNKLVSEFRAATTDLRSDARLAGQKLYDVLVKPLEKDLNGVKAKTLVWSLDGNLRYAPIAALWDKNKGYLAQNYANVIITLASRDNLTLQASGKNNMQALGVGVSKSVAGFSPLGNVPEELEAIVSERNGETPLAAKESGVMSGRRLLDEQFTYDAFRNQLGRFPVVHAATHFKFIPGTRDEALNSFLLLGNGEKLTLAQIQNAGTIFNGVQLLTLSACDTAYGGKDADGREIEGFGAMAQKKGAKAVMATLWAVADESTRQLMVDFYRLYQKPGTTKAEALRQAQLSLLKDEKFAHPYFWSPFILIGNWK